MGYVWAFLAGVLVCLAVLTWIDALSKEEDDRAQNEYRRWYD
jgi:hypothetical protein